MPSVVTPASPLVPEAIESERLRMRKVQAGDADEMYALLMRDPDLMRYMVEPLHADAGQTRQFISNRLTQWDEAIRWTWTVLSKDSEQMVGRIGLRRRDEGMSVGYMFGRAFHGRGYATEAVLALAPVSHAIEDRLLAYCDMDNLASARVLQKAGFREEGVLREYLVLPNLGETPRDCRVFCRTASSSFERMA